MDDTTDVTAFLLAGGKSRRMGADKAALEFCGKTLLAVALELAYSVTSDVRLVGPRERLAGMKEFSNGSLEHPAAVVEDVFPDRGPLGGIHAALSAGSAELNLMLAIDTPFLSRELLLYVLHRAGWSSATVTVPRVGGRYHPLCAVYRRGFLRRATEALTAGRNRIDALFVPEDTLVLEESELARLSFSAAMFDNLNTREEYERARKLAGKLNGTRNS
jgi:molybdopterin-guanine dinucleotide biosynthesis protein A